MFEIDKEKFGSFVSSLRKAKGYTQKELAEKLYISDKAVSKWEVGASLPDTALLVPLSELLGVSVTELLMCGKLPDRAAIDADKVESIIKTALSYSEEKPKRAYLQKNFSPIYYALALIVGWSALALNYVSGAPCFEVLITQALLCTIFGAYFCIFVRVNLPEFYDKHAINIMYDGIFRMNMSGIRFNNKNWPYIVKAARIWSCASMAILPALSFIMSRAAPDFWSGAGNAVLLALLLGGLFIPIYAVGKKYE